MSQRTNERLVCRHRPQTALVRSTGGEFELPDGFLVGGQTAFLSLEVEATLTGRCREPLVEFWSGGATRHQYFERGATGTRHLNVSPLLQDASDRFMARIGVRAPSLRWKGEGLLTRFDPPPLGNATVLVVAPHPDDAEIAAFGLYAAYPTSSWVVTITAGEWGTMSLARVPGFEGGANEPQCRAHLRVWDSLSIPQLAGVPAERCLNLVYPDRGLEKMSRDKERPFRLACEPGLSRVTLRARNPDSGFRDATRACTWTGLVEDLRLLIEKAKPTIVVCPHPVVDDHLDHAFATVAIEQALRLSTHRVPTFLLYVVHAPRAHDYPYGFGDAVVSLPPWTDEQWIADSIYSHPLSVALRRSKYFAVEAAHDARAYRGGAPKTFRQLVGAARREIIEYARGATADPSSFFLRRAARPNELFYVVSGASLSDLVKRRSMAHG